MASSSSLTRRQQMPQESGVECERSVCLVCNQIVVPQYIKSQVFGFWRCQNKTYVTYFEQHTIKIKQRVSRFSLSLSPSLFLVILPYEFS